MKSSIITVVFNGEKTIARAVESIYSQLGVDVEHIIIDGDSTDNTVSILKKYKEKISIFLSEPDHGIYDAMNKGVTLATGEIIGILNADDYYAANDVLSSILKLFESKDPDAIFGNVEYFDANKEAYSKRVYRSSRFEPRKLCQGLMPAHPALFLQRRVYERFGLFNPKYKIAGDFDLIARIFKGNDLDYVSLDRVLTRMQTGGISTQGLKSTILLNREIMQSCRENQIPTNLLKIFSRYPRKLLEFL